MYCSICGKNNPQTASYCTSCGASLSNTQENSANQTQSSALPPGTSLLGGTYIIDQVLGQGGFGITYLGKDEKLQRPVAIKEFFLQGSVVRQGRTQISLSGSITAADYQHYIERFVEEARTLARFQYPGIVQVYAAFEANNTAYMVMEFLEGKTLKQLVQEQGVLPESEAIVCIEKVGEALEVVHQANLLHRDIKPDNIMLTNDSRIVLMDFGAARAFVAEKSQSMTAVLTPGYAPLEQYGTKARFAPFTDIYALGGTLYYLLTGEAPVDANDRVMGVELPTVNQKNPRVSKAIAQAVMQAMSIKSEQRPQSIQDFLSLLHGQREVDYTKLGQLLAEEEWKEATKETKKVMLKAVGREENGWLRYEDINNFPYDHLYTIDQLWLKTSGDRYGLSVQQQAWEKADEKQNASTAIFLAKKFGWLDIEDESISFVSWLWRFACLFIPFFLLEESFSEDKPGFYPFSPLWIKEPLSFLPMYLVLDIICYWYTIKLTVSWLGWIGIPVGLVLVGVPRFIYRIFTLAFLGIGTTAEENFFTLLKRVKECYESRESRINFAEEIEQEYVTSI